MHAPKLMKKIQPIKILGLLVGCVWSNPRYVDFFEKEIENVRSITRNTYNVNEFSASGKDDILK